MLRCGLLGERLTHSYSPQIHALLCDYEYKLYEKSADEVVDFIKNGEWDALNVTIPYKKIAAALCDELSDTAEKLKSVNTLVRKNGRLYGYNTDYFGFMSMVIKSGVDIKGKKALVLGSGGTSVTVCAVLRELGADVVVISRSGENNYDNLYLHKDASLIVNATPVGMYPKNLVSPVNLSDFPDCAAVLDVIYNPLRTDLLMQAENAGIKYMNGLLMLCAQAKKSAELFTNTKINEGKIEYIEKQLTRDLGNIILIGMPGCGKSVIAKRIAEKTGREIIDTDSEIVNTAKMSIPEIFERFGEDKFRQFESEAIMNAGKRSGTVISTGGGCVTVKDNYRRLHQNGIIVWIKRDLSKLSRDGRPLSLKSSAEELYESRKEAYESFCDIIVENSGTVEETADKILDAADKFIS